MPPADAQSPGQFLPTILLLLPFFSALIILLGHRALKNASVLISVGSSVICFLASLALLATKGLGDIGDHFPPSDPQWKGASSDRFLVHALTLAAQEGYSLANADITIICEAPKIGPHRQAMRSRLSEIMDTEVSRISVKATTTELLGFTGRGEGIAAQAIVTFEKTNR